MSAAAAEPQNAAATDASNIQNASEGQRFPPSKWLEKSFHIIGGISQYIWQLVRGTVAGAWKMTGGAIAGGVAEAGKQIKRSVVDVPREIGKDMIERIRNARHIGKLGHLIQGIALATGLAVANVLVGTPLAGIGGSIATAATGAGHVIDAVAWQYDKAKKADGDGTSFQAKNHSAESTHA